MDEIEKPVASPPGSVWGSDVVARLVQAMGYRHITLNPGASFRGLHDSLVNDTGNRDPQMILCLHEGNAVAIAHGWAKVTGTPMAVVLHSNVGLMHGTMGLFNAWCDRVPMLVLGATGPVDAAARRPWIDWLHTMSDQAALVRPFLKWDNQPASVPAAMEALLRANLITRSAPCGPVYINLDAALQESRLEALPALPDLSRYAPPAASVPAPTTIEAAVAMIRAAKRPMILPGRGARSTADWARRVALAEALDAVVLTDFKVGAAFPTDHPLHAAAPTTFLTEKAQAALRGADLVLAFDWVDLAGTLKQAGGFSGRVIHATLDQQLHNGFGMEHFGLPPVDLHLACEPAIALHAIADALGVGPGTPPGELPACPALPPAAADAMLDVGTLSAALGEGLHGVPACLVRLPLGWRGETWHFRHPLDYLGGDGGAGIGAGPGMLTGAAMALQGTGRLPVAVLGDGDTLMSATAFWTAAHYRVPMLAVICNNRSFYNDEVHQERVAKQRNRPVENKWIGQRIADPDIDIAALARSQGATGIGPVHTAGELAAAVRDAVARVRAGETVVIDARVAPGYSAAMTAGLTRHS
jgi:thiamine pyrophosphate-dependent acetolactate synthase large subunit-like protein